MWQVASTGPSVSAPSDSTSHYSGIRVGTSPEGFATLGDPNAPVKVTQLSSYSCGGCEQYYTTQIVPILDDVKAGKVYYTFIPVTLTGEFDATPATKAAYCALQQGKFWQMHDLLFDWQIRYGKDSANKQRLIDGAKTLGIDTDKFGACLTGAKAAQFVATANDAFNQLNLISTPSILVNGKLFRPVPLGQTEPNLRRYIDQLMGNGYPA